MQDLVDKKIKGKFSSGIILTNEIRDIVKVIMSLKIEEF